MRKLTLSEKRERALQELATRKNATPTAADIEEATKAMNSYYRLCALDERTCNSHYTAEQEAKAFRWIERINQYLKPFDACIVYFGYLPTICKLGTTQDLYLAHFYN